MSSTDPIKPPYLRSLTILSTPTPAVLGILLIPLLAACGGGSGGSSGGQDPPQPVQGASAHQSIIGGHPFTLSAGDLGVADARGYAWRQVGGPAIDLEGADTASVRLTAPDVAVTGRVSMELEATASDGTQKLVPFALTAVNASQVIPVPREDYRLTSRGSNTGCHAPPPPPVSSEIALQRVFPGITIPNPADMDQAPGDDTYWYVTNIYDRKIYRFANREDASELELVLDLDDRSGSLRSMAFHPAFASNGRLFVQVHDSGTLEAATRLLEFTWSDELSAFDPASERLILAVDQPHSERGISDHQGGNLAFGPDGYLYTALGDGTRPRVFNEYSQDTSVLWGSLLRIDVDQGDGYAIPPGNPFAGGGGRPEIYAWGFRHPWKWNFDFVTGDIWLGDVGLNTWEEVNRVELGGNYGWPLREGSGQCADCELEKITIEVNPDEFIDPVLEYRHDTSNAAVTGGYVYRGSEIPGLEGVYIFGDFSQGKVFALRPGDQNQDAPRLLTQAAIGLVSFGQDVHGELYALDFNGGGVYKLVGKPVPENSDFPALLSATGCVAMDNPNRPLPGMIPYSVQVPLWSDAADKTRWMALPDGGRIDTLADSDGDLDLPVGTVLVKHFRLSNRYIETRLLMRHDSGDWAGYSYEWNDEQTEAVLLPGARDRQVDGQLWHYPSRAECLQCHTRAAGGTLGLTTRQLNTHQSHGDGLYSQLRMLNDLGVFSGKPDFALEYAAMQNDDAGLEARARAYLEVNCSGCHRPNGNGGRAAMDLRLATSLAGMNICGVDPQVDTLGIPGAKLLSPGDPESSVIHARMIRRGTHQMPPLGTNLVDPEGAALVASWIASIDTCP